MMEGLGPQAHMHVYDMELKKLFKSIVKWNATNYPSEKIICREIVTNENDSKVVNVDSLFDLFLTELFDILYKLITEMLQ